MKGSKSKNTEFRSENDCSGDRPRDTCGGLYRDGEITEHHGGRVSDLILASDWGVCEGNKSFTSNALTG